MKVLVLTTVFPNASRPTFGVFTRERMRHVAAHAELVVVAPIPWFPWNRWIRGSARAIAPFVEEHAGMTVYHPRVFSIPRVGKCLDGVLYFLSLLPFMTRLRRRFPFELIDAHFAYPDGVAAVLLARAFGCRVLVTLRGTTPHHTQYALRRPQIFRALAAADRVITVSDSLRTVALGLGIDAARTRVIPNGVDPTRFYPSPRGAAREALGLPEDREILVAVGALIERKGHHRVIALLPRLVAKRPRLLYVVVGGDVPGESNRRAVETLVREHRLENHVRVVPPRPHDEVRLWMAAADVFCLATRWEGWCNALMEALACGAPVVTTQVGGNAEFIGHGRDGFLVPFWDGPAFAAAIEQALDGTWDRDAIAVRARAHGWDKTAAAVLEEFRAVLGDYSRLTPTVTAITREGGLAGDRPIVAPPRDQGGLAGDRPIVAPPRDQGGLGGDRPRVPPQSKWNRSAR